MNKINVFWLVALNIQLLIGFTTSYGFLNRHIIVNKVLLFMLFVLVASNVLYLLFKKIKIQSLRSFFSIVISSLVFMFVFMEKRSISLDSIFSFDFLLVVSALIFYTITLLKLYITTPILVFCEFYFKKIAKFYLE